MSGTVHGTAVLVGANGVLIRGDSGTGKSMLALALIGAGAQLIGDDRVMLSACYGRLIASAPRAISGKIELRGRGILNVAHEQSGVIRLVADIVSEDALERMPEAHQLLATILGIVLPRQPVPAATERAIVLVNAALRALPDQSDKGLANGAGLGKMAALPL